MIPFLNLAAAYEELKGPIDEAVSRVLSSGHFIGGPEVEAFEHDYAQWVQAKECISCGNGLDAIAMALQALGVQAGDEVIVPSHTFIATWLAVSKLGAIPVPVEPAAGSFNVDAEGVERAITPATRAVIIVHLYGHPAPVDRILEVTRAHGLKLIEDAAQAHGATCNGRRIGGFGDATTWSFYPSKNLGALGDGGAVTTNDPDVAKKIRSLRNYGSQVKYYNEVKGINSRLDPIHAAALAVKLPFLEQWNARRQRIAARYNDAFAGLPLTLPIQAPWATSVWHLYVLQSPDRETLISRLADAGVQAQIHYPVAVHRQQAYAEFGNRVSLPIAERMASEVFSLPIGPHMSNDEVDHVIDAVRRVAAA